MSKLQTLQMAGSSAVAVPSTPLSEILNLNDFETAAEANLKPKAWAYYASAADSSLTKHENSAIYRRVRLRPRVMVDVSQVDAGTKILGLPTRWPFMISPAAMGRLAHPDGEKCLVRAAGQGGIIYGPSNHSSCSHKELIDATVPGQPLFFQLYMHRDRAVSRAQLLAITALGYKAVILTVDTPFPGNRELDLRTSLDPETVVLQGAGVRVAGERVLAVAATASTIDCSIAWDTIQWIKDLTGLPVIVKGIQTVEDALLAVEHGAQALMLSNHGGRQVSGASTPLEVLLEIREYAPQLLDGRVELILDGGIRRGTDVVIALCLGATAVSLGRPFMYSLPYGTPGALHLIDILSQEVVTAMALLGARSIADLHPALVNTVALRRMLAKL